MWFPRETAQVTGLVYLSAHLYARISSTLPFCLSALLQPLENRAGDTTPIQWDNHGSTGRKQDPAEGRQENPRGGDQENNNSSVRRRSSVPPRLVTSHPNMHQTHIALHFPAHDAQPDKKRPHYSHALMRGPAVTSILLLKDRLVQLSSPPERRDARGAEPQLGGNKSEVTLLFSHRPKEFKGNRV